MPGGGVVLLSGGLGGARLAPALARLLGERLTIVVNVGDDLTWRTLRICPDVDSILYALAGVWDGDRGWGRRAETFLVGDELSALGARNWFNVGDRDLALHLRRTELLADGCTLSEATAILAHGLGVETRVIPASDEIATTRMELIDGRTLDFQEWYVRMGADPELRGVATSKAAPSPGAREAIAMADVDPRAEQSRNQCRRHPRPRRHESHIRRCAPSGGSNAGSRDRRVW